LSWTISLVVLVNLFEAFKHRIGLTNTLCYFLHALYFKLFIIYWS